MGWLQAVALAQHEVFVPRLVSRGLQLQSLWIIPIAAATPMDTPGCSCRLTGSGAAEHAGPCRPAGRGGRDAALAAGGSEGASGRGVDGRQAACAVNAGGPGWGAEPSRKHRRARTAHAALGRP